METKPNAVRLKTELLGHGKWLRLEEIHYRDRRGHERRWESAERAGDARAVVIAARLQPSGRHVLIEQYRPPASAPVLEFPAGLIDAGETIEQTAVRELREETGYTGTVSKVTPMCLSSAGMTGEAAAIVEMIVDETRPENHNPEPQFDGEEDIEVFVVTEADLPAFIAARQAQGARLDVKLAMRFLHCVGSELG
jgi:8-oxo-dGTP pyrophosphatase MutT (NUDIX family)